MKVPITATVISVLLCAGSCSFIEGLKNNPEASTQVDASPKGIVYVTDASKKRILEITDTLYLGDTLRLKFKTPHPGDLAIIDPANRFFYLVYNGKRDTGIYPLLRKDSFVNQSTISISTDQAKASILNEKLSHNEPIFTTSGLYEIRLGERLDTLDGNPVEVASVFYIREKRRRHYQLSR